METIKIFLSELDPAEPLKDPSKTIAFWSMPLPVSREVSAITQSSVENEVLNVFEKECVGVKISDVVHVKVFDKNNNKIFGGYITPEEEITLYPIIDVFQG